MTTQEVETENNNHSQQENTRLAKVLSASKETEAEQHEQREHNSAIFGTYRTALTAIHKSILRTREIAANFNKTIQNDINVVVKDSKAIIFRTCIEQGSTGTKSNLQPE